MLLNFSFDNWMSYYEKNNFSMIATRERQHNGRIPRIKKYDMRVLPISAIYGGNASGKTNFCFALKFVKKMIVSGTGSQSDKLINIEPFRLDKKAAQMPSRFSMDLLIDETIYQFSFAVTRSKVVEEKLVKITSTSEVVLYNRQNDKPNFDQSLKHDEALKYAFKGTRDNQLFLTNSVSQKIDTFRPIYEWFKDKLVLVAPDDRFQAYDSFIDEKDPLYITMNEILPLLDTGVIELEGESILLENAAIPDKLKEDLKENVSEDNPILVMSPAEHKWYTVSVEDGEFIAKKLVTYHDNAEGGKTKFEIFHESDGTRRVLDLLPAILDLTDSESGKVYIIDEIDRSLHTLLSKQLIQYYLSNCSESSRSQLVMTTHDLLLMNQDLLRRDEMWVTERSRDGKTSMYSFSEFKDVRYDKDIRKSYMQGRLGGIPRVLLDSYAVCREVE